MSAGEHTITVDGGVVGAQLYGFRLCSSFSEQPSAGSATFELSPRSFKDVNGNMAVPDKGFKLTTEILRRKPDSALVGMRTSRPNHAAKHLDYTFRQLGSLAKR